MTSPCLYESAVAVNGIARSIYKTRSNSNTLVQSGGQVVSDSSFWTVVWTVGFGSSVLDSSVLNGFVWKVLFWMTWLGKFGLLEGSFLGGMVLWNERRFKHGVLNNVVNDVTHALDAWLDTRPWFFLGGCENLPPLLCGYSSSAKTFVNLPSACM
jgi:hypothetical protein